MNPDFQIDQVKCYNVDCMDFMRELPDNYYDLSICDPPYGIGISGQKENKKGKKSDRKLHADKGWDKQIPSKEYFDLLNRVSKNQIIWGANYFVIYLNEGHKGWIVWDKGQHGLTMSDCELAYSSFDVPTRVFTQNRCILQQEGGTIHPTQKPVALYKWILTKYAKEGDKILDTHGGSFTHGRACLDLHFDLDICELDKEYFDNAVEGLKNNDQLYLF